MGVGTSYRTTQTGDRFNIMLKTKSCHHANCVITGGTGCCHYYNRQCHQWWQSWHLYHLLIWSMTWHHKKSDLIIDWSTVTFITVLTVTRGRHWWCFNLTNDNAFYTQLSCIAAWKMLVTRLMLQVTPSRWTNEGTWKVTNCLPLFRPGPSWLSSECFVRNRKLNACIFLPLPSWLLKQIHSILPG